MSKSKVSVQRLLLGERIDNMEIIDILGSGAYGEVYTCQDMTTKGHYYAIKSLAPVKATERRKQYQDAEIELHGIVSEHKHIIKLERVIRKGDRTYVVLEHGKEGDLFTAITDRHLYYGNHPLIKRVFLQLIDSVMYCHSKDIYHRDIKPENIIVFDGGRTVKLADFGLATKDKVSRDFECGSTFYFSPECQGEWVSNGLNRRRRSYATAPNDVWALGVILINLATKRNPWQQASLRDRCFKEFVQNPDFLRKILPISLELCDILKQIFCLDPSKRITLKQLRERIIACEYFTLTAEVERLERQAELTAKSHRIPSPTLPPSPPLTPSDDRCRSPVSTTDESVATPTHTNQMSPITALSGKSISLLNDHRDEVPDAILTCLQTLII